ncbi:MAG TPA: DMT family transporter [Acidimicrobiales bacterium]|nr:DMT family transporter [Acidimicrobiales bacterium]
MHPTVRRRATLLLAATTTGWGTVPLIVRSVHLPPAAIVAARFWFGALALTAVLVYERRRGRPSGPKVWSVERPRCVAVCLILLVHWLAEIAAYQHAPIGTALFIIFLAPVGIAAFAPSVLGEHIDRRTIAALGLALVGFACMTGSAVHASGAEGLALSLLAMVTFIALVLVNKPLADTYGGVRAAQIQMTGAGVLIVPIVMLAVHFPSPEPSWLWLVVLGVVHTGVAIAVYLGALSIVGATTTGVLGYLEPATAVFWAWLVLGESPSRGTLIGGVAILAAGLLVVRNEPAALEVASVTG